MTSKDPHYDGTRWSRTAKKNFDLELSLYVGQIIQGQQKSERFICRSLVSCYANSDIGPDKTANLNASIIYFLGSRVQHSNNRQLTVCLELN